MKTRYELMNPETDGTYWCNSHQRKATHWCIKEDIDIARCGYYIKEAQCDPALSGILLPCNCVNTTGIAEIEPDSDLNRIEHDDRGNN